MHRHKKHDNFRLTKTVQSLQRFTDKQSTSIHYGDVYRMKESWLDDSTDKDECLGVHTVGRRESYQREDLPEKEGRWWPTAAIEQQEKRCAVRVGPSISVAVRGFIRRLFFHFNPPNIYKSLHLFKTFFSFLFYLRKTFPTTRPNLVFWYHNLFVISNNNTKAYTKIDLLSAANIKTGKFKNKKRIDE